MRLRDEKMHLHKPRLELRRVGTLQEIDCCDLQHSEPRGLRLDHLAGLAHLLERNPGAIGASVHSEMRRVQADAQRARESALAKIQLARQRAW